MKQLILILALLFSIPARAAVGVVQEKDGTGTSVTLTSNTTSGNALGVIISSATAGTVKIGAVQTLTQDGVCTPAVASIVTCAYYTTNITTVSTAVACTGCGTANAIAAVEFSSANGIEPVVGCFAAAAEVCQLNNAGSILGIQYQPGYSSEGVMFLATCSGSSTAPTVAGLIGGGNSIPNGNAVAWGISSGTTVTSMKPTSGCNQSAALALAFTGTGSTQQLVANPNQVNNSAQATTGSATVTAVIFNVGDLVSVQPWCLSTCGITTLTLGAQSVTCPAGAAGVSNTQAGQPRLCHVVATSSGSQTLTFTPSGSPTAFQVSYQDFSVSANNSVAFDTAATSNCQSSCSEGATVTVPSLTPSQTGSLLINFVATLSHTTGPHTGSPQWGCYAFIQNALDTITCQLRTTENMLTWILTSASGATTPNVDILNSNDPYQSIIASYKFTSTSGGSTVINKNKRRFYEAIDP